MTPEELWLLQREKVLAWLRLGFSLVAIAVLEFNPERGAGFPFLSTLVLYCFFAYSLVALYALVKGSGNGKIGAITTGLDLLWVTAIVFLTRGTGSAFFVFYLFPVITASTRYGFKGSLIAASIGAVLYWVAHMPPFIGSTIGLGTLALRTLYLLILAFIFGLFSNLERAQSQKLALLYKTAAEAATREERQRISRDLHDSLIQVLASLRLRLEGCRRHLMQGSGNLGPELKQMEQTAIDAIHEIRRFIAGKEGYELRPGTLSVRLREVVGFLRDGLGLSVLYQVEPTHLQIRPEVEREIYLVVTEALMNVAKHALASEVEVLIHGTRIEIRASIEDNGVGFDPGTVKETSYGLQNMRERINKLKGNMTVQTTPGKGTRISFVVPAEPDTATHHAA